MITELEKAWFAGILDGEGHIGIGGRYSKDGYKPYLAGSKQYVGYYLLMEIEMAHQRTILRIEEIWGLGNCYKRHDSRYPKTSTYRWTAFSNIAKQVLEGTYPYLVTKRKQAELAIIFQTLKQAARKFRGRRVPIGMIEEERKCYDAMYHLNHGEDIELPRLKWSIVTGKPRG